jgi:WD40 repeat protein
VRLWDRADLAARPRILYRATERVRTVLFSPDSRRLAVGGDEKVVHFLPVGPPDSQLVPAPRLAPGFRGADEVGSRSSQPGPLLKHDSHVWALAFTRDGRWLATASGDRAVRLWDLAQPTATPLVLGMHNGGALTVAFSPDERWIVSGGQDQTVRLWPRHLAALAGRGCAVAGRNLRADEWERYFRGQPYHQTCGDLPAPEGRDAP